MQRVSDGNVDGGFHNKSVDYVLKEYSKQFSVQRAFDFQKLCTFYAELYPPV